MGKFTEFLKGLGEAIETLAFHHPWLIVAAIFVWKLPKIAKHTYRFLIERQRIQGKLEDQRRRFALEIDKKQRKISKRKRKDTQ